MAVTAQVQVVCLSKSTVLGIPTVVFGLSGASNGAAKVMLAAEAQLLAVGESYLISVS